MQSVIQIACTSGPSLRDIIVKDERRLAKFNLIVSERKKQSRSRGWAKLHGTAEDAYGAINVQWIASSQVLLCRVITRKLNPGPLSGDLLRYLLTTHRRRVQSIHIVPA